MRPLLRRLESGFPFSLPSSLGFISLAARSILLDPLGQRLLPAISQATIGSIVTLSHFPTKLQPCPLTQFRIGVGPALGAALGAAVYKILLLANYKALNPGQDDDGLSVVRCEIDRKGKFREIQVISGPSGAPSKLADENV